MTWHISVHNAAAKQLEAIPPDRRKRILDDVRELAEDPFRGLVKALRGKAHKGLHRKVSGRYRVISNLYMLPVRSKYWGSSSGTNAHINSATECAPGAFHLE
jgi:mRNA-degrading endonuclease RelE of RelBE toxin-antitoxin system